MGSVVYIRLPFEKTVFVNSARKRISVDYESFDEKTGNEIEKAVAKNLYNVAKHARRMGLQLKICDMPEIQVTNRYEGYVEDCTAMYSDGKIYIKEKHWGNDAVLAHEIFHFKQAMNQNMWYNTHLEKSYTEGGADFFSISYRGRKKYRVERMDYILESLNTELKLSALHGQFKELGRMERAAFLCNLLGMDKDPESEFHEKYRDGGKFAAMSFLINGRNEKATIRLFLNQRPESHINIIASKDTSVMDMLVSAVKHLRRENQITN